MKVKILEALKIELVPETDADFALLNLWSEKHQAKIAGSVCENSETTKLLIDFKSGQAAPEKLIRAHSAINVLIGFIARNFSKDFKNGEKVVDVAIRLLTELKQSRKKTWLTEQE